MSQRPALELTPCDVTFTNVRFGQVRVGRHTASVPQLERLQRCGACPCTPTTS